MEPVSGGEILFFPIRSCHDQYGPGPYSDRIDLLFPGAVVQHYIGRVLCCTHRFFKTLSWGTLSHGYPGGLVDQFSLDFTGYEIDVS